MRLLFDGVAQPVRLTNCAPLLPLLETVLAEWPFSFQPGDERRGGELLAVSRSGQEYVIQASWLDESLSYADEVDVICKLVAELIVASSYRRSDRLSLHGAAVEYKGRLIFFPSRHRAGKSTLVAALAALGTDKGMKIFADDVLTLDIQSGRAIANGVAPRVRLPLPKFAISGVETFIQDHILLNNQRYAYLALAPEHQARRGTTAEIAAFVRLQREPQASAELVSCSAAKTLEQVIRQNFGTVPPVQQTFTILQSMVERSSRYVLHYDDSSQAAELVLGMLEQLSPPDSDDPVRAVNVPERLSRGRSIYKTLIDGEAFLVNAHTNAIYKLDPLAGAIWRLLEDNRSLTEIIEIVRQAFPGVDPQKIQNDIENLIDDMTRQDLIDGCAVKRRPRPHRASVTRRNSGRARTP